MAKSRDFGGGWDYRRLNFRFISIISLSVLAFFPAEDWGSEFPPHNTAYKSPKSGSTPSKLDQESFKLVAVWAGPGGSHPLQSWSFSDLGVFKKRISRERDPESGKLASWTGILLSSVVEKVLERLPVEGRAQVDLIVLKGKSESAMVPRALISKYPMLLAFPNDDRGPLYSIVPWSSKPRIMDEDLPLEKFFVPQLSQIELTSYRERYSNWFLKRRTDPSAMRGEKLFVQNCMSCHAAGHEAKVVAVSDESKVKKFAAGGHPYVKGSLRLTEKDWESVLRYLSAYRLENPPMSPGLNATAEESPRSSQIQGLTKSLSKLMN